MHVDNSKQLPTVISFCSGYGGIERGLELASIEHRVLAYVEIEAFAIANLVAKMEQGELVPAPIYTDIKTFPAHLFRDSVDIITGGYPCQPFSVAVRAQAFDDPRHLFPYILNHVRTIRPAQCFFENVEGHINRGLESVLQDLEGAGYDSTWGVFSAEEVGAPHQRKRIFILANSDSSLRLNVRQQISEQGKKTQQRIGDSSGSTSEELANPINEGSQGGLQGRQDSQWKGEHGHTGCSSSAHRQQGSDIWNLEPNVGRVAHGVPGRVYRLKGLGNSIVPKIAEEIGKAIMEAEADDIEYRGGGAYKAMLKLFNENLK